MGQVVGIRVLVEVQKDKKNSYKAYVTTTGQTVDLKLFVETYDLTFGSKVNLEFGLMLQQLPKVQQAQVH